MESSLASLSFHIYLNRVDSFCLLSSVDFFHGPFNAQMLLLLRTWLLCSSTMDSLCWSLHLLGDICIAVTVEQ